jgi:hypothetical protein
MDTRVERVLELDAPAERPTVAQDQAEVGEQVGRLAAYLRGVYDF